MNSTATKTGKMTSQDDRRAKRELLTNYPKAAQTMVLGRLLDELPMEMARTLLESANASIGYDDSKLTWAGGVLYGVYSKTRSRYFRSMIGDRGSAYLTHEEIKALNHAGRYVVSAITNDGNRVAPLAVQMLYIEAFVDALANNRWRGKGPGRPVDDRLSAAETIELLNDPATVLANVCRAKTAFDALQLRLALIVRHGRCKTVNGIGQGELALAMRIGTNDADVIDAQLQGVLAYLEDGWLEHSTSPRLTVKRLSEAALQGDDA